MEAYAPDSPSAKKKTLKKEREDLGIEFCEEGKGI